MESLTRACICSPAYGASIQSFNDLLDLLRSRTEKLYPDKRVSYHVALGDMSTKDNKAFYTANIEIREKGKEKKLLVGIPRMAKYADQALLDAMLAIIELVNTEISKEKLLRLDMDYKV